jgi:thiosulfate/3-mercaptopyruvate sulfurtransferase
MRQRAQFKCIGIEEAEGLIKRGGALIVDVRDAGSHNRSRINGSKLVSMKNISDVIAETTKDTPILIYCYRGHASREYAQVFSDFGYGEVYSLDGGYEGWKSRPKPAAAAPQTSPLQQWLVEHGYPADDVNAIVANGMTPLMTASHAGGASVVRTLLAAGASLDVRNGDGNNALWLACVARNIEIIDLLVDAGINIDNRNDNGATCLMYAASSGRAEVVERLLVKGADTAPETFDGFSAVDLASTEECLTLLRQAAKRGSYASAAEKKGAPAS